jgi:hypothetical protein
MNPVARAGDVSPTASPAKNYPKDPPPPPTATGSWAEVPGSMSETTVSVAASDGKNIVCSASCQFIFSGKDQSNNPFTSPPVTVTLTPSTHKLKVGDNYPLVDKDEVEDTYGNKLSVSSTATWRTA